MIYVDAHCDTLTKIIETNSKLYKNDCHIDIARMKEYKSYIQFFAAFIDPIYAPTHPMKRAIQIIDKMYEEIGANKEIIMLCHSYSDISAALESGKIGAVLSIEGGEALQGDLSALRMFHKLGVKSICLTWNYRNEIADGISEEAGGGLTPFGRELIKEMNALGMIVDLSHISERGFWDTMEISSAPVILSHSNAKALCNHKRNLTNEQIKMVKKNGGVIGVNFYPAFLSDRGEASLEDILNHIDYMAGLIGTNHIGVGADFDGIESTPIDVFGIQDLYKVFEGLLRNNYPEESVKKIAGENFLRVIKENEYTK